MAPTQGSTARELATTVHCAALQRSASSQLDGTGTKGHAAPPRFTVTDPFGSPPVRNNRLALMQNCRASAAMFRRVSLSPLRGWAVGSGAAVEWRCTSVAAGKNGGPDCQMNFTGVDVFDPGGGALTLGKGPRPAYHDDNVIAMVPRIITIGPGAPQ